jgi:hypothetical protein
MAPEDIHKTVFRVPGAVGLFEYVVMTFGLKNAGATYQHAMDDIFHDLIGKLVEIYIEDVVVKFASVEGHLGDVRQLLEGSTYWPVSSWVSWFMKEELRSA